MYLIYFIDAFNNECIAFLRGQYIVITLFKVT